MTTRQNGLVIAVDRHLDDIVNMPTGTQRSASKLKTLSLDVGKTPARTKARRALGDISNHRQERSGQIDGKERLSAKTPVSKHKLLPVEAKAKLDDVKISTSKSKLEQKFCDNIVATKESVPGRRVDFALHDVKLKSSQNFRSRPISKHGQNSSMNIDLDESFDEIRPAGRTWGQQVANGDNDEDFDDASLEGVATLREDYDKMYQAEYEHRIRLMNKDDEDAAIYLNSLISEWVKSGFNEAEREDKAIRLLEDVEISTYDMLDELNLDLSSEVEDDDSVLPFLDLEL